MLYKNLPWSEKWWKIPFRISLDTISAWKGLLTGDGGYFLAILRAHFSFYKWVLLKQVKVFFQGKKLESFMESIGAMWYGSILQKERNIFHR